MKILILSQYYPPETGACSNRISGFARGFARAGHEVTVITAFPNYPFHRLYSGFKRKWVSEDRDGPVRLLRTWLTIRVPNRPRDRFLNYLGFFLSSLSAALFKAGKADILLATSGPILVGFSGALAAWIRGIPFVLDLRDVWPERIIAAGEFKNPLALRILEWMERFLYRRAAKILCVTEGLRENLIQKGVPDHRLHVITNGTDLSLYEPGTGAEFSWESLGLPPTVFAVVYAGTLGLLQDHQLVIESADRLRSHHDIHFILVGEGVKRASVQAEVQKRELTQVHLLDNLPRRELAALLSHAHIGINSNTDIVHNQMAIPVKMFDYMAAGLPVVIANDGEVERLVREGDIGICVRPGDVHAFSEAILRLFHNRSEAKRMGGKGKTLAEDRFNLEKLTLRVEKILSELRESC